MGMYEVNWAVGGRRLIEAASSEDAYLDGKELLPWGGDWQDIDVVEVEENSKISQQ